MKYIIDEKDIRKIAEDLLPAVFAENDKYNRIIKEVKDYLYSDKVPTSFVDRLEDYLVENYYDKCVSLIKNSIEKNGEIAADNISEIRRLVKEKKWNQLDVMFGFDSSADHDKNREDMKCHC